MVESVVFFYANLKKLIGTVKYKISSSISFYCDLNFYKSMLWYIISTATFSPSDPPPGWALPPTLFKALSLHQVPVPAHDLKYGHIWEYIGWVFGIFFISKCPYIYESKKEIVITVVVIIWWLLYKLHLLDLIWNKKNTLNAYKEDTFNTNYAQLHQLILLTYG